MRLGGVLSCLVVVHCSLIYNVSANIQLYVRQDQLTTTTQQSQDGSQTLSQATTTTSSIISSLISKSTSSPVSVFSHPSTNTSTASQPTPTNSTVDRGRIYKFHLMGLILTRPDPPLPLQPTISPANVLAGIFLLIPGFIYGFFSIKYQL